METHDPLRQCSSIAAHPHTSWRAVAFRTVSAGLILSLKALMPACQADIDGYVDDVSVKTEHARAGQLVAAVQGEAAQLNNAEAQTNNGTRNGTRAEAWMSG